MASQQQQDALLYIPANQAHNARSLDYIKSTSTSIAGAVAGLVGLSGWVGFLAYIATSVIAGLFVIVVNSRSDPKAYFKGGNRDAILAGLGDHVLGYILWWTCAFPRFLSVAFDMLAKPIMTVVCYGLVHVYE